ncbi:MAG: cation diffusion facilitator family transporter [Anaerolineales bacterium]|nr:cation diffusion facilitator family transporter [Anaerolineales bacterium]MDW8277270.1 cation diffusion facilitator family transporter [Anaerolineales bacterium]
MSPHAHFSSESAQTSTRRLSLSLGLTLAFVVVEALAGLLGNSLALLTDAAHNFTDVLALGLSWYAMRKALQPANARRTFGYHRAGILAAMVNSASLGLIALGIFYEVWHRFLNPPEVNSGLLVGVGLAAFLVNAVTAWLIKDGSEHDLNLRSAFLHLMGDVLSTLGAVLAGVVIFFTRWNWLDPLVSALIGLLIVWNAWNILRETLHILLESTPRDIDLERLVGEMNAVPGVKGIHDLHVWSIDQQKRLLSAHVVTGDIPISQGAHIQDALNELLTHRYGIAHTTLQLESVCCGDGRLFCEITEGHASHA